MSKGAIAGIGVVLATVGLFALATQVTIWVVQPIGALPEGAAVVIWRKGELQFIDSPDAVCDRKMGGVSLLCRGLANSAALKDNRILVRLWYADWLYDISTGGKRWDR